MKHNILYLFFLLTIFFYFESKAQNVDSSQAVSDGIQDQIESIGDVGEDSDFIENVEILLENPVDLNTATIAELQEIPEVDNFIAQKIVEYRIKNSGYHSLGDLQNIPEISDQLYRRMLPYVRVILEAGKLKKTENDPANDKKVQPVIKPFSFQLRQRNAFDFQNRKGFSENKFQGNKFKVYNRLKTAYKNFSSGIIIEKDPGESNYADYLNGYFQIADFDLSDSFKIRKLILGAYQASYGQGLIQWTYTAFGKNASTILSPKRNERGIQTYLSSDENQYFSGVAFSILNSPTSSSLDLFYSSRKMDGKVNQTNFFESESANDNYQFYSFDFTGYHRDSTELRKKVFINLSTIGFNFSQQFENIGNIGFTGILTKYGGISDDKLNAMTSNKPDLQDYYSKQSNYNTAYSFNFDLVYKLINLYGESAVYNEKNFGHSIGIIFKPASSISYTIHFRKLDSGFSPFYGKPFSEKTSTPANETGFYHGLEFKTSGTRINLYYDSYLFPWSTYQNIYPRDGRDWLLFCSFEMNKNSIFEAQYKNEKVNDIITKTDQFNRQMKSVTQTTLQSLKIQVTNEISKNTRFKSRVDQTFYKSGEGINSKGFAWIEQLKTDNLWGGSFIFQYHFFDTPFYENRIYVYEYDLPGLLTSIPLYGKGVRFSIVSSFELISALELSLKISTTNYSDRKKISSGDSEINGNSLSQMSFQLDWKF